MIVAMQVGDQLYTVESPKLSAAWYQPDGSWYCVLVNEEGELKLHHWPAEEDSFESNDKALAWRVMNVKEELIGYET